MALDISSAIQGMKVEIEAVVGLPCARSLSPPFGP